MKATEAKALSNNQIIIEADNKQEILSKIFEKVKLLSCNNVSCFEFVLVYNKSDEIVSELEDLRYNVVVYDKEFFPGLYKIESINDYVVMALDWCCPPD